MRGEEPDILRLSTHLTVDALTTESTESDTRLLLIWGLVRLSYPTSRHETLICQISGTTTHMMRPTMRTTRPTRSAQH